ncbi:MAG: M48 family metalloprotease [Roseivirga sp.]|nr:M48 family metalloprotease [Roseivirga sp.]
MMFFSEEVIRSLGLTLLDSLWQGAVLLFICGGVLWLLRNKSSRLRYYVVLSGLLALPVLGVITFSDHHQADDTEITLSSEGQLVSGEAVLMAGDSVLPDSALSMVDQWHQWAQSNAAYISLIWALGFALFTFRLSGGFYMVHKLKRNSQEPVDDYWVSKIAEMCTQLKIRLPVELRQSARLTSPIVLGYLKPMVIFPIGLLQGLPTDQVEAILLHELAHIKRFDYLLNVLVSLLQVVFFYHPAYWWLQSQLDSEREYSCDDLVLHQTGNSLSLIKALAAVREFQIKSHSPALAFAGQKNQLLKRVERIMKKKTRTNWLGGLISMSVLLLSFFLMSYQSKDGSQDTKKANEPIVDSTKTLKTYFEPLEWKYDTDSVKFSTLEWRSGAMSDQDTLTVEKALLNLLDPEQNGLLLEMDGKGNLISVKKDGKELAGDDLKIYKTAHVKLKQYIKNEKALSESMRTLEVRLHERERALDELRSRERALEEELAESQMDYNRLKTLELYERELQELQKRAAEQYDKEGSKAVLVEELRSREKALLEYTEFIKRYNNITEEFKALSRQQEQAQSQTTKDLLREYEILITELRRRNVIAPVKFEFTDNTHGQRMAAEQIARHSLSQQKPLIVVDNKVYKDWTFTDLDKIDAGRKIESMDIRKDDIPAEYKKLMKGRDVFVRIVTSQGKKGYQRPKVDLIQNSADKRFELEREEAFAKTMLNSLETEGLLTNGWKGLELSTDSFLINDKKQSKKLLKKYLKLYEEVTGRPLAKGKTIELQE